MSHICLIKSLNEVNVSQMSSYGGKMTKAEKRSYLVKSNLSMENL